MAAGRWDLSDGPVLGRAFLGIRQQRRSAVDLLSSPGLLRQPVREQYGYSLDHCLTDQVSLARTHPSKGVPVSRHFPAQGVLLLVNADVPTGNDLQAIDGMRLPAEVDVSAGMRLDARIVQRVF